jgi:hypothetical protein
LLLAGSWLDWCWGQRSVAMLVPRGSGSSPSGSPPSSCRGRGRRSGRDPPTSAVRASTRSVRAPGLTPRIVRPSWRAAFVTSLPGSVGEPARSRWPLRPPPSWSTPSSRCSPAVAESPAARPGHQPRPARGRRCPRAGAAVARGPVPPLPAGRRRRCPRYCRRCRRRRIEPARPPIRHGGFPTVNHLSIISPVTRRSDGVAE